MRTEVLRILKNTGGYLSGQQLCEMLGVSRITIWKVVGGLKEEGYITEAVRNRGYRLVEGADVITQAELTSMLHTQWIGARLAYFDETDSTNTGARKLAEEGVPHGTLVATNRQTAGEGRRGRSWVSPAGIGIWVSVVLRLPMSPMSASMLTLIAGLAVVRGVKESTGLEAMIKWPNDVVPNGEKICGILTEMNTEVECIRYVIPRVGINVNMDGFPEEIKATAASLKLEAGRNIKCSLVIAAVADNFKYCYGIFMKTCDMSGLRDDYSKSLANLGREVLVLDPRGQYKGKALGVNGEGGLLVRREDGNASAVISGEILVRGVYGCVWCRTFV